MTFSGVLVHHTAGPATGESPSLNTIINGRAGLPGPLANYYVSRSGVVHFITDGKANHAGRGASQALERIEAGRPPLGDAKDQPGYGNDVVGNQFLIGIEIENPGDGTPYPDSQMAAVVELCADLCKARGWTADRVWGHKEWTNRKIDPSFDMNDLRRRVAVALSAPTPLTTEDEDMRMVIAVRGSQVQYGGAVWLLRGENRADLLNAFQKEKLTALGVPLDNMDADVLASLWVRADGHAW